MADGIGGVEAKGEDGGDISWQDKQEEEAEEAEDKELGR
jgi:hypothetical protein